MNTGDGHTHNVEKNKSNPRNQITERKRREGEKERKWGRERENPWFYLYRKIPNWQN